MSSPNNQQHSQSSPAWQRRAPVPQILLDLNSTKPSEPDENTQPAADARSAVRDARQSDNLAASEPTRFARPARPARFLPRDRVAVPDVSQSAEPTQEESIALPPRLAARLGSTDFIPPSTARPASLAPVAPSNLPPQPTPRPVLSLANAMPPSNTAARDGRPRHGNNTSLEQQLAVLSNFQGVPPAPYGRARRLSSESAPLDLNDLELNRWLKDIGKKIVDGKVVDDDEVNRKKNGRKKG